ncbi:MAG: Gfo/Idh/MocA family oxidoreductase [Planctomycetia bacterium]|nr:Gfo/Idh/MocA family oxidoreductase [Planctomycetia bacterium]
MIRKCLSTFAAACALLLSLGSSAQAQTPASVPAPTPVRVGLLGVDNYQALEYAQFYNSPKAEGDLAGLRVTAVYPVTSAAYPNSEKLTAQWMQSFARLGSTEKNGLKDYHPVEVVDSIEALLAKCDAVIMMGLDGRVHLQHATPVLKARKPLVIGRPLATTSADAAAILQLAAETKTPCFSCSQHRFSEGFIGMRDHPEVGKVLGCDVYGGYDLKAVEADLSTRSLHSLETIYTIMGPGVESVSCVSTPYSESYTLVWSDGRVGTYRGIKQGAIKWSATVFGDKGVSTSGIYGHGVPVKGVVPTNDKYTGYEGLARAMAKFFKGGPNPIPASETLEMFAVFDAAELSKQQGGAVIKTSSVVKALK